MQAFVKPIALAMMVLSLSACQNIKSHEAGHANPSAVQEAVVVLRSENSRSWSDLVKIKGVSWQVPQYGKSRYMQVDGQVFNSSAWLKGVGTMASVNGLEYTESPARDYFTILRGLMDQSYSVGSVFRECTGARAQADKPAYFALLEDNKVVYVQAITQAANEHHPQQVQLKFTRYRPNEDISLYSCK